MDRRKYLYITLIFLVIALLFPHPAGAQSEAPVRAEIDVGFDGQCKYGNWIPVQVTLINPGDDFSGNLSISYSQADYTFAVDLAANAQKAYSTEIFLDKVNTLQDVVFYLQPAGKGDKITLERVRLNCAATRLIGVLTDTPSAFTVLNALQPANTTDVSFFAPETVPENWLGLQALDILIIANTDATQLGDAQQAAIHEWTLRGGQVVFGGGAQWKTTLSGFEDILPMNISRARIADVRLSIGTTGEDLELANIVLLEGQTKENVRVPLKDGSRPLVAQHAVGVGLVTLLTFDPNIAAFRAWDGAIDFYDYILVSQPGRQDFTAIKNWNSIVSATSRFQGLKLPSTSFVLLMLSVYILLVGPAQYLVLKRLKRLELSWVTIPVITIVFTTELILTGWDLRGSKPRVNELAIVHHWAGQERAAMSGFVSVFAPKRDNYQMAVEGDFIPQPFPPHNYFNTPNNEWTISLKSAAFQAATDIDNSEIMPLGLQGNLPAPQIDSDLELSINARDARLQGVITNHSSLALKDCVLIYPGGFELIGNLDVGQNFNVNLPVDVLAPTNASISAAVVSGLYNPYLNTTSVYINQLFPNYLYSDLQNNKQYNLLAGIFGVDTVPSVGFLLIGWDDTRVPFEFNLLENEVDAEYLTAYLTSFDVQITTDDNELIIPPVFFDWYIPETSKYNYSNPYNLYLAYLDSAEIYYRLDQSISYTQAKELIIHLDGASQRADFPLNVFLWNYNDDTWDQQSVTGWGDYFVTDPAPYLNENSSEIRIMLSENGNGGNPVEVNRVDFSLVVEP